MENVLTIDLEEWYHANYEDNLFESGRDYEERVIGNTNKLLELFERHHAKATFFTLGVIAEKYPELIRLIHQKGHEIASHGYGHQLIYKQTEREFEEDLQKSIACIESAIGHKPKGYRAPSWSIKHETPWVFSVLKRNGIEYDASIFPVKTFLYGIPDAPRVPFQMNFHEGSMLEFPTSTLQLGRKNIPFSGGFYFRFLPYLLIRRMFRTLNKSGLPVIFYLHPREIDPDQPRLEALSKRDYFIHYYQVGSCERKLEKLLKEFRFTTVEQYLFHSKHHFEVRWSLNPNAAYTPTGIGGQSISG
ncbi:XrtA system polysaccharide deacetylase [Paenibacillus sp. GCM10027628]|uniref:XrtA system polysaccharide deacetylase n=1 Tax=Paenibacillus sp. GCM10027628 TaxID=3273413 RepID=UPI00363DD208